MSEQEDGPVEVVGHVDQLGDGEQGEAPAERLGFGREGTRGEVGADDERGQVDDEEEGGRKRVEKTADRHATRTSLGWSCATRTTQALEQDVAEDEQHAHEDDQVGIHAVGSEQLPEGRLRRRVVQPVDQRAEAQDEETGSHIATLPSFS